MFLVLPGAGIDRIYNLKLGVARDETGHIGSSRDGSGVKIM